MDWLPAPKGPCQFSRSKGNVARSAVARGSMLPVRKYDTSVALDVCRIKS